MNSDQITSILSYFVKAITLGLHSVVFIRHGYIRWKTYSLKVFGSEPVDIIYVMEAKRLPDTIGVHYYIRNAHTRRDMWC